MKIAICLSGFIRTWEQSKPSFFTNLVQDNDCDIFIHTYNQNYYEYSAQKQDVYYSDEEIKEMFQDLNLKDIIIEDRDKIFDKIETDSKKYENIQNYKIRIKESSEEKDNFVNLGVRIYDQLRKIHHSNELRKKFERENNFEYDFIVKTRFDVLYVDKINWNSFTDSNIIYVGEGGTAGFPDDLVGIAKNDPINAYMDRFLYLDDMCFTTVMKNSFHHINWYSHHGEKIFPIREFCAHDTLIRNCIHKGFDVKPGGFRNRLIRNESQILNWNISVINGETVHPIKTTNGVVLSGDNSYFDVKKFNDNLK